MTSTRSVRTAGRVFFYLFLKTLDILQKIMYILSIHNKAEEKQMKRYRIFLMAKPGGKWEELPELDIQMFNEVFKEWNKRHFEGTLQTECQTREDMDAVLNDVGHEQKPGCVYFVMEVK